MQVRVENAAFELPQDEPQNIFEMPDHTSSKETNSKKEETKTTRLMVAKSSSEMSQALGQGSQLHGPTEGLSK